MNKRSPGIILLKLLPLAVYYLVWIIDMSGKNGFFLDIVSGLFAGTFMMLIEQWGLIAFEVYLLASPKGSLATGGGIAVIALSTVSARWMYMMTEYTQVCAGWWRPTLIILVALNGVYMLVTLFLVLRHNHIL